MKIHTKVVGIGLVAFAIAGSQLNLRAQESEAPAVSRMAATSHRAIPFHGKLKAIDREAGTLTVGTRTFKITPDTKYLQGGLDEATVGESVGGSYWKAEDGTLMVNSIRFGPKGGRKPAEEQAQE